MQVLYEKCVEDETLRFLRFFSMECKNQNRRKRYQSIIDRYGLNSVHIIERNLQAKVSFNEINVNAAYSLMIASLKKRTTRTNTKMYISELRRKQKGMCPYCGEKLKNPVVDHIIPWSLVGDELGEANYQLLCQTCNLDKGNSTNNIRIS